MSSSIIFLVWWLSWNSTAQIILDFYRPLVAGSLHKRLRKRVIDRLHKCTGFSCEAIRINTYRTTKTLVFDSRQRYRLGYIVIAKAQACNILIVKPERGNTSFCRHITQMSSYFPSQLAFGKRGMIQISVSASTTSPLRLNSVLSSSMGHNIIKAEKANTYSSRATVSPLQDKVRLPI